MARPPRKKYPKQRNLPHIPRFHFSIPTHHISLKLLILCICFVSICLLVFFTSPKNPFALVLFFIIISVEIVSLMRALRFSNQSGVILAFAVVTFLVLKINQMATLLNFALIAAITACFMSFANQRK